MPYNKNEELPENVKDILPVHAQDIYKEAFNSAWNQYDQPEERKDNRTREETAHAVAWPAVKNSYQKDEKGNWIKKNE